MIRLLKIREEHKDKVRSWRNQPGIARYMYSDHEIGPEEHERWFRRILADPTVLYWIITVDDEEVGVANLYNIDQRQRRCYWAFYLSEQASRGRGTGAFVEYAVLSHVFDSLQMEKLCCEVLSFNEAVVNMHKKFGFQQEGYFRQHVVKGGARCDVFCLGMLKSEWEMTKADLGPRFAGKAEVEGTSR